MQICQCCGQQIKPQKAAKPQLMASIDTSQMSDAELFKHYKKTAPLEDCRFWIKHAVMSDELRVGFIALESAAQTLTIARPAFYRQLIALQALWRQESNARERAQTFVEVPTVFEKDSAVA